MESATFHDKVEVRNTKVIHYFLGIISAVALIIVLLVSSLEIAVYSDYGWYQTEYEKYRVFRNLGMEMSNLMEVTEEMMSYLRGDREDLVVYTTIFGREQEFFNESEKAHMVDVRNLFESTFAIRKVAGLVFVFAIVIIILMKSNWKKIIPRCFLIGTVTFFVAMLGFIGVISTNFDKYFTMFHEMFFDNDLWLMDPKTDLMIRMLPEGIFSDMLIRIGDVFFFGMVGLCALSLLALKIGGRKNSSILDY